ncbi:MAG: cation:proton antiporter [Maricaulaceae bacterium]
MAAETDAAAHAVLNAPFARQAMVFLGAALVCAPICRRLKLSPIFGYLLAGLALGPQGLAVFAEAESVRRLAELGVVFLLFAIGLELSFERIMALRRLIFGLGGAQMIATGLVVGVVAALWGNGVGASVILGACFAFSTTAMGMQLLSERRETATAHGRSAFAVLLMQDLAVAPMLVAVTALGSAQGAGAGALAVSGILAMTKAVLAVVAILVVGRFGLRYAFRWIAAERSPELFMAAVALTAVGAAWATELAGLSTALGAFLAGLVLAETEFRAQIEADVEPFKGLLVGLFFFAVGMSIDLRFLVNEPVTIAASVVGLIVIKFGVLAALIPLFARPWPETLRASGLLSQAGEFGFVVVGAALGVGLLGDGVAQFMAIVIALSMLATPGVDAAARLAATLVERRSGAKLAPVAAGAELEGHVVVLGYGRVGRLIGEALNAGAASWVALDRDAQAAKAARSSGAPVLFGDATRMEMLERAGLGRAAAVIITLDDSRDAARALDTIRSRRKELPVLVRAADAASAQALMGSHATVVIEEAVEPALQLAKETLQRLDLSAGAVDVLIDEVRAREAGSAPRVAEAP